MFRKVVVIEEKLGFFVFSFIIINFVVETFHFCLKKNISHVNRGKLRNYFFLKYKKTTTKISLFIFHTDIEVIRSGNNLVKYT